MNFVLCNFANVISRKVTAEKHVTYNRKFQVTPYGKDMYFFDIFINDGRICMGFVADH